MKACGILFGGVLVMVAARPGVAIEPRADSTTVRVTESQQRSLSAIRLDVHAALRAEALSSRQGENVAEVMRLVNLYREMAGHSKRDESALLKELGLKVRSRLMKVQDRMEREIDRGERDTKKELMPAGVTAEIRVLAQQMVGQGGAAGGQVVQTAAGQQAGAQIIDYGPELVEVIQRTISPATWDINGGSSAVVYFAPLRALVVSAPADVHAQVGDLLGQLRAAP